MGASRTVYLAGGLFPRRASRQTAHAAGWSRRVAATRSSWSFVSGGGRMRLGRLGGAESGWRPVPVKKAACRRVPTRPTPSAAAVPTTALLILPEWLTPIMTGEKTVELRAFTSLKRDVRIGFCASGTGRCWGEATFLHCEGPLDDARLAALQDAHGVRAPEGAADAGAAIRAELNWRKRASGEWMYFRKTTKKEEQELKRALFPDAA